MLKRVNQVSGRSALINPDAVTLIREHDTYNHRSVIVFMCGSMIEVIGTPGQLARQLELGWRTRPEEIA